MPRQTGFNLVELMVSVSIAAITLTLAVPSFQETILNNRLAIQANDLLAALNLARSEAVKSGVAAAVCRSADGITCGNAPWHAGWIVFADINGNGLFEEGSGTCQREEDCILQVHDELEGGNILAFTNLLDPDSISFNAKGVLRPSTPGTFVLCDRRGDASARHIVLTPTGYSAVAEKQEGISCP